MSLKEILQAIVSSCSGGRVAFLMGFDGIAIEESGGVTEDQQVLVVEYVNILKEVVRAAAVLKSGQVEEVIVNTSGYSVVVQFVSDDYFTFLILERDGNIGKARFLMKRDRHKLLEALS